MNFIAHAWALLSRHVGKGFAWAVGLAAFVVPLGALAVHYGYLSDVGADLLPVEVLVACVAFLIITAAVSSAYWRWQSAEVQFDLPRVERVEYKAHPYEEGSELRKLTSFAQKIFDGDTMDAETVQMAVAKGAAIGIRVTDSEDNTIGFVDAFHLDGEVLDKWKKGQIRETDIKPSDFQPIPPAPGPEAKLELMFGAIYLKKPYDAGLTWLVVGLAEAKLRSKCAGYREVALYATIFKDEGGDLARILGFKRLIVGAERRPYGGPHDLWVWRIRPDEPSRTRRGVGSGREVVVTEVQD